MNERDEKEILSPLFSFILLLRLPLFILPALRFLSPFPGLSSFAFFQRLYLFYFKNNFAKA